MGKLQNKHKNIQMQNKISNNTRNALLKQKEYIIERERK